MDKERDWTIADSIIWYMRRSVQRITNKDIAQACKLSEGSVSMWLKSDGGEFRVKHIVKIAELLGISVEKLCKGVTR